MNAQIKSKQRVADYGEVLTSPEIVRIHNPVAKLDHAKREIVAARFCEIPPDAVQKAAERNP